MASNPNYGVVTEAIQRLAARTRDNSCIDPEDYLRYDVKRGLRDLNGKGVVAGLTEISDIVAKQVVNGEEHSLRGQTLLPWHRCGGTGPGRPAGKAVRIEETAYLLMLGKLPDERELREFREQLATTAPFPTTS